MKHILRCKDCMSYTLKDKCPKCGGEALKPMPAKYSPLDKYGGYRRRVKFSLFKKEGLI